MAVGLNLGEKVQIGDKKYRILNDLVDVKKLIGKLYFEKNEGQDLVYNEERGFDGTVTQTATGEIRGIKLSVIFDQHKTSDSVLIVDMPQTAIEELDLKYLDEVELIDPVVSISSIGRNDIYKVFASGIKKKSAAPASPEIKKEEQNQGQQNQVKKG